MLRAGRAAAPRAPGTSAPARCAPPPHRRAARSPARRSAGWGLGWPAAGPTRRAARRAVRRRSAPRWPPPPCGGRG
ncbi:hypothetical protein E6W39_09340 [Kitasatospora acidiphila]|uniref:Uncharacterized protein n=1 Tax=Kitasatospora acidiphila TaxID=2567942 RepID=A0A540W099_9ACTN|nr:hypothetical protein E6W39_09340 [Kitasatospora acidiphila]